MLEVKGDIWELAADARVITTNGQVKNNGQAVMGRGIALAASQRYPTLAQELASKLRQSGNHVYYFAPGIITFPTKEHWRDRSPISLIERSSQELALLADEKSLTKVLLPPPGCGLGGLDWRAVKEVIAPYLDDRFTVVHYDKG